MSMRENTGKGALPVSEACERNKVPIAAVLRDWLPAAGDVLEIGSGTAQHVVWFAGEFPATRWQPSDTGEYLAIARARVAAEGGDNVADVIELDVRRPFAMTQQFDALFSANTLHFMSEAAGASFFGLAGQALLPGGVLVLYGPFNYGGEFTSPSNARFDQWLKSADPERGIRDMAWVNEQATAAGLSLQDDVAMPANNRCLVWHKMTGV